MTDRAWRLRRSVLRARAKGWPVSRITAHYCVSRRHVFRILADARREIEDRQQAG